MSHFVLIVAMNHSVSGDWEGALSRMLAPYDENMDAEPYRKYEDGPADQYWWYNSIQKDAQNVADNDRSHLRPYDPNGIGYSSAYSRKTLEQQWAEVERDAAVYHSLPHPVTWEALTAAHNSFYCDGNPYSDSERLEWEAETDRAYTISTYNPKSKWDWYQVGGRWSDYFPYTEWSALLLGGKRSWALKDEDKKIGYCDGGPKRFLDLERLRSEKEAEAGVRYDKYQNIVAGLPIAEPWSTFVSLAQDSEYTWDQAREDYGQQPRVRAVKDSEIFGWGMGCEIQEFSVSREVYLHKARVEAVPGYALLTTEGEWMAPGEMGWFGVSSDNPDDMADFKEKANAYIDGLDDDVLLIAVDLHI